MPDSLGADDVEARSRWLAQRKRRMRLYAGAAALGAISAYVAWRSGSAQGTYVVWAGAIVFLYGSLKAVEMYRLTRTVTREFAGEGVESIWPARSALPETWTEAERLVLRADPRQAKLRMILFPVLGLFLAWIYSAFPGGPLDLPRLWYGLAALACLAVVPYTLGQSLELTPEGFRIGLLRPRLVRWKDVSGFEAYYSMRYRGGGGWTVAYRYLPHSTEGRRRAGRPWTLRVLLYGNVDRFPGFFAGGAVRCAALMEQWRRRWS